MVRALIVEPAGRLWGSERALLDMVEAAPELEMAVCCPPDTELHPELARRRVRSFPYFVANLHRKARWHRLRAAFGVLRACLVFRPDVIHLNQSGAYRVTLPAAMLLDLPIVTHVRLFEDAGYLARRKPDPRRLVGIIAVSEAVEMEIRSFPDLKAIPLHRIYDAYARTLPSESPPDREPSRIACVGRIVPTKGQDVLLKALGVPDGVPHEADCLIVGDGDENYVRSLKGLAPPNGVEVKWLGFVREVIPLLRTCAVLACPSHREPLGRVIFEAWDAGAVPVVYGRAGGTAEIVSAANGGILYEEQTPEALAEALRRALQLGESAAALLVENGRRWMDANCSVSSYGRAFVAILRTASRSKRQTAQARS